MITITLCTVAGSHAICVKTKCQHEDASAPWTQKRDAMLHIRSFVE